MSSGTKCCRIGCEVGTEGVVTGRVRSLSSRCGQASCLSRIAGVPLQGLKSAAAFVLCKCAGVSGLLVHDEWRGSSFHSEKAFSAPRGWSGMTATGAVAVQLCVTRTTAVTGGTHQSEQATEGVFLSYGRDCYDRGRGVRGH